MQSTEQRYLLDHSTTVHLKAKGQNMPGKLVSQFSDLRCSSMFKKLSTTEEVNVSYIKFSSIIILM